MSFDLLLDSSLAKQQRDGERNVSHDFTINFSPPIYLYSGNYKAPLDELITMSYSWYNIDASFDKNKIRWRKKTKAWKTLTFPNGMYDYKDINRFLQNHIGKVDPKDKDSAYNFNLYFDLTSYRVVILVHEDYELDLSQGSFSELLGYGKSILSGDSVGRKLPNIPRGVAGLGVYPLRSDQPDDKKCSKRCHILFFNSESSSQLSISKSTASD